MRVVVTAAGWTAHGYPEAATPQAAAAVGLPGCVVYKWSPLDTFRVVIPGRKGYRHGAVLREGGAFNVRVFG